MIKLLNNLSIRSRMLLSVALFLATLLFSMTSAFDSIGANVEFAAQEKKGNFYQRPLAQLLHSAGNMRVELSKVSLGQGKASIVQEEIQAINKQMEILKEAQDSVGEDLQFTKDGLESRGRESLKYENFLAKWKSLSAAIEKNSIGEYDAAVASYIADIRGMIAHSGDTSNLILDPDLDSYYLMDVTLLALPQAMDRLAEIGSILYAQLAAGELTSEQRTQAAVFSRMVSESDISRIVADMDTALKEDRNFYGIDKKFQEKGPQYLEAYTLKNNAIVAVLDALAQGKTVDAGVFALALLEAQKTALAFLSAGYDHLDDLLVTRIQDYKGQQMKSVMTSLAGILISFLFFFVVVFTITKPLAGLTSTMRRLAANDLEARVDYIESKSEIGQIAHSIQTFKDNGIKMEFMKAEQVKHEREAKEEKKNFVVKLTSEFETNIGGFVKGVASASTKLQGNAESLSSVSCHTSDQSKLVERASERTSESVQVVAAASEELSSSISEISRRVTESSSMIQEAVEQISKTNNTVKGLTESSNKIGDIVQLINDIAGQTNLLALNATIEAARAGDAGKGFAVVASEVKNLAKQTAKATEEISSNISLMQNKTGDAVNAIQSIGSIVEKISFVSGGIASAVTQQTAATQEIAKNIQNVSSNTMEVTENIKNVTKAAGESLGGAEEVLGAASELSRQSESLKLEVGQFLSQIRAS